MRMGVDCSSGQFRADPSFTSTRQTAVVVTTAIAHLSSPASTGTTVDWATCTATSLIPLKMLIREFTI